jgi:hypothetical protein
MKKIKLLVYALIVCMSFVSVAEAKGRSGSFKSGFTSQKRSAPKPAPTYTAPPAAEQTKKTAFGSFGTATPKTQTNAATAPQSQMSKDLTDKGAQTNALKTADARNKTNAEPAASESGWFRSGNQNASAQKPQAATIGQNTNANNQTANNQTFDRRSGNQQASGRSNGLMYGLLGFMVGNSLAHHASAAPVQQQNSDWQNDNSNGNATNSLNADGTAMLPEPAVETESWFMKFVRVILWVMIIGGVIWAVRKVKSFRQRKVMRSTNYSLGS